MRFEIPECAARLLQKLEQSGHTAYVVGGCVRDLLLGIKPDDWDICTSATPDEMVELFKDKQLKTYGLKHGTLTVVLDKPYEITTYRVDGDYTDNRHPGSVSFVDNIELDLARRDFTVNAMAYHPDKGLVDVFGGQDDLAARVIRCVREPDARFNEDGLRILRALRFASKLGFEIDPATASSVHKNRQLLQNITPERVNTEFGKLLLGRDAEKILLEYPDVIGVFLPELLPCVGFEQRNPHHCFDVWQHTAHVVAKVPRYLPLRLAALFHDMGKPRVFSTDDEGVGHFYGHAAVSRELAEAAMTRLKFPGHTVKTVLTYVENHDYPIRATEKCAREFYVKFNYERAMALIALKRADALAQYFSDEKLALLDEFAQLVQNARTKNVCTSIKELAVDGKDMLALGASGKRVGTLLNSLFAAVTSLALPNERSALLARAKELQRKHTKKNREKNRRYKRNKKRRALLEKAAAAEKAQASAGSNGDCANGEYAGNESAADV